MLQKFLTLFKLGYPGFWRKKNSSIEKIVIFILLPFSFLYLLISFFLRKVKKINKVGVPVICVGNLNTGGSGKTPFVIHLARLLNKNKKNIHIVTRGYLGKLNGPVKVNSKIHNYVDVGDEALLLSGITTTWVSKNRFEGALMATLNGAEIIILDDGLQNYDIYQNFKILVIDGEFGFGNEFILPSGPLRQTINSGIKKSDIAIIFDQDKYNIKKKLQKKMPVFHVNTKINKIGRLKNKKIIGFSGIGRPEKFLNSLKQKKFNIIKFFPFPDHYNYSKKEINNLINYARKKDSMLVSTKKDEKRISMQQRKKIFFLELETKLIKENNFINFLKKKIV